MGQLLRPAQGKRYCAGRQGGPLDATLPFYRGLLEPIGWSDLREAPGEQGETIHYLSVKGPGVAALGLREKRSDAHGVPYDRYAIGLHHLCFDVPSREVVDERADWLRKHGARIESGPAEYDYTPGYYAVFFCDPDRIKLEVLHRPTYWESLRGSSQCGSVALTDEAHGDVGLRPPE